MSGSEPTCGMQRPHAPRGRARGELKGRGQRLQRSGKLPWPGKRERWYWETTSRVGILMGKRTADSAYGAWRNISFLSQPGECWRPSNHEGASRGEGSKSKGITKIRRFGCEKNLKQMIVYLHEHLGNDKKIEFNHGPSFCCRCVMQTGFKNKAIFLSERTTADFGQSI